MIGNTMVYSDVGHITTTFMRTLTPDLTTRLKQALTR